VAESWDLERPFLKIQVLDRSEAAEASEAFLAKLFPDLKNLSHSEKKNSVISHFPDLKNLSLRKKILWRLKTKLLKNISSLHIFHKYFLCVTGTCDLYNTSYFLFFSRFASAASALRLSPLSLSSFLLF
jgi:hypothetical protein